MRNRLRSQSAIRIAAAAVFAVVAVSGQTTSVSRYDNANIRSGPTPGVRFTSGLMVCDEELYNGRWVNRYWTSTGQIKPDFHLEGQSQHRAGLAEDAFELGIEGQNLAGTWKWVKAEEKHLTNPDGLLVTVELQSTARPITIKLNTLMHGGPIMVRWLEITNTGSKAIAITSVSPWSGILWDSSGYTERAMKVPGNSLRSQMEQKPSLEREENPAGVIRPSLRGIALRASGLSPHLDGVAIGR